MSASATKKPKHARDGQTSATTTPASARASLTSLPVEILAEILLLTCSPLTVLSVSRTCSFLYQYLAQNPAASFIWRGVRKTCQPMPLPGPAPVWKKTEADYAAFVFGGGVCEVCQKATRAMYASFALRIRLCGSWHCRKQLLRKSLINVALMLKERNWKPSWVPNVESDLCFYSAHHPTLLWSKDDHCWLRKTDWEKFRLDCAAYQTVERYGAEAPDSLPVEIQQERERLVERCRVKIQGVSEIMEFSGHLTRWRYAYDRRYQIIKDQNHAWTTHMAEHIGWDPNDLVASQAYGSLLRRKTLLLEHIEWDDVLPVRSVIESELLAVKARHNRQKAEASYKQRLTEVKKIYERIRCGTLGGAHTGVAAPGDFTDMLILPSLSTFCALPSVRALKGSPDPSAAPPNGTIDIKSSPLATSLIVSDLHTWLVPVQKYLMGLLGCPNGWQSASRHTLHPLKRVTARFFCRLCGEGEVGRGYRRERCLDLKGVCSHVCVQGKSMERRRREARQERRTEATDTGENGQEEGGSRGKKKSGVKTSKWRVDMFMKDEKAVRVVRSILELTGLSEEDPSTASSLTAKGGVIRCVTCKGWVVMDFDTAVGHAHRHESMQVQLLSTPFVRSIPSVTFEHGTSEVLLGPSHRARNLCKKVNYGCRHCVFVLRNVRGQDMCKGAPRLLDFNGLRSHVKEKHGVQNIGDEDFFCYFSVKTDVDYILEAM